MGRKKLYVYFKQRTNDISHEKSWTWLRKGNLKRETESLLITAPNKTIRSKYVKVGIDKTQQNRRCISCGDKDETINYIISESSKLAQKGTNGIFSTQHLSWRMTHSNSSGILSNKRVT